MLVTMTLAAQVWHFWISIFLVVPAILLVVGTIVGYVTKVTKPRYPNKRS